MFPLEVKPLLVGQGLRSWQAGSSYWPDRKTTIKGDEYFMGYTGTIGRGVWAIVKPLSGRNARQTSLSPFDSWLLGRREKPCAPPLFYYFQTRRLLLLSPLLFSFFSWLNWAWRLKKKKENMLQIRRTFNPLRITRIERLILNDCISFPSFFIYIFVV